jgi:hypothetical protein
MCSSATAIDGRTRAAIVDRFRHEASERIADAR